MNFLRLAYQVLVVMDPLVLVVFLGKLLIAQELGVHTPCRNILYLLRLFNAIGMRLVCVVVGVCYGCGRGRGRGRGRGAAGGCR
jgi:hypothetical protein